MITPKMWFKISQKANEMNRGKFTEREIHENADMLYLDYRYSKVYGKPNPIMQSLCANMVEDMDKADYADTETELDLATMEKIITDWYEENVKG